MKSIIYLNLESKELKKLPTGDNCAVLSETAHDLSCGNENILFFTFSASKVGLPWSCPHFCRIFILKKYI